MYILCMYFQATVPFSFIRLCMKVKHVCCCTITKATYDNMVLQKFCKGIWNLKSYGMISIHYNDSSEADPYCYFWFNNNTLLSAIFIPATCKLVYVHVSARTRARAHPHPHPHTHTHTVPKQPEDIRTMLT
jgi:hypothetical protein